MLSCISIGTITWFSHHFCAKKANLYTEYIYMRKDNDLAAVTDMPEWAFQDELGAQIAFISTSIGIGVWIMYGIYIKVKRANLPWPIPL